MDMDDKTYQQALHELQARVKAEIHEEIHKRLHLLGDHTIESITQDISNQKMKSMLTNFLTFLKIESYLGYLQSTGLMNQAEYEELRLWLLKCVNAKLIE